jgi:hypothetical protein
MDMMKLTKSETIYCVSVLSTILVACCVSDAFKRRDLSLTREMYAEARRMRLASSVLKLVFS